MEKKYIVEGMTCGGCVNNVRNSLLNLPSITKVEVKLEGGETLITQKEPISLDKLQKTIGKYKIREDKEPPKYNQEEILNEPSITTYKPLIIIVLYILGTSLLVQYPFQNISLMDWGRHFMAGFFLVFSFFKILNIEGFVNSYRMYDIVAKKWAIWGYIYPFIELGLGILYLINYAPFYTNITTAIILGISSIGVIESNLNKRKIKCACLGDVFNLPMSTVTIIEDVTMVLMALIMLYVG